MIEAIATVWVPVSDMGRALEFYEQTLGLDVVQREEEWSMVEVGGVRIGLNGHEGASGDGGGVIAFRTTAGIEEAVEDLASRGVEVRGGVTEHPWGRVATFEDPDGNDLQYYEPPSS